VALARHVDGFRPWTVASWRLDTGEGTLDSGDARSLRPWGPTAEWLACWSSRKRALKTSFQQKFELYWFVTALAP